jgi:hypothetical protein
VSIVDGRLNPFGRDLIDAVARGDADAYLVSRELHYLAAVGAVEHIRKAAAALGVHVPTADVPLVPHKVRAKSGSLAAFNVYRRAERLALGRLALLKPSQRNAVARRLVADVDLCAARRAALLAKRSPVPGAASWFDAA